MNEVDLKKLVEQGQKAAFCLGTIIGSISTILNNITIGIASKQEIYQQLHDVHKQAGMQVHEIYYKHLEKESSHDA